MASHLDKFDFLGELGRGAFGVVYKVRYKPHFNDPTIYALKIVSYLHNHMDPRELEVISSVCMTNSQYVVRVYTYWVEADLKFDKYCILMELCETNLASYIHKRYVEDQSYFTEQEIWEIICHIMEGIQQCHDLNFTHRDLKPQNVLYSSRTKTWKLTDFGIAERLPASTPVVPASSIPRPPAISPISQIPSPPPTPPGPYVAMPPPFSKISVTKRGSPGYVAPELYYHGICSRKGDIWSIGCILYELACGKMAFPLPESAFSGIPADPLRNYYFDQRIEPPEVAKSDNPRIMVETGKNYFGGPREIRANDQRLGD